MNPIEALKIVDAATGEANLTRAGHSRVIEALKTLQEAISEKEEKPELVDNGDSNS